jgi:hypothetical protein
VPLSVDVDGYKGDLVFDLCPDLDVIYAYPRGDVSRELARRNGKLDRSVDGRHQDVWDADFCEPKQPRHRPQEPLPTTVQAGGYTLTALAPPVARGEPPPSRAQYDKGYRGASLWEHARTTWYEGATGLPLTGSDADRTRQYDKATRAYRYDARGIPSRPSPKKARSGARSTAPARAAAEATARRGAVAIGIPSRPSPKKARPGARSTAPARAAAEATARRGAVATSRTPVDSGGGAARPLAPPVPSAVAVTFRVKYGTPDAAPGAAQVEAELAGERTAMREGESAHAREGRTVLEEKERDDAVAAEQAKAAKAAKAAKKRAKRARQKRQKLAKLAASASR